MKVIGLIHLLDATAFEDYRAQVGATVERYGGQVVFRGKVSAMPWNELNCQGFEAMVELSFPTEATAQAWIASPEYSALLAVRSKAMRLTLFGALAS
jgi:uncharacterized protein (DUF1330 family)